MRGRLGQLDVVGADFCAECLLDLAVLVIFGDSEDIGTNAPEVILKVEAMRFIFSDDCIINHHQVTQ